MRTAQGRLGKVVVGILIGSQFIVSAAPAHATYVRRSTTIRRTTPTYTYNRTVSAQNNAAIMNQNAILLLRQRQQEQQALAQSQARRSGNNYSLQTTLTAAQRRQQELLNQQNMRREAQAYVQRTYQNTNYYIRLDVGSGYSKTTYNLAKAGDLISVQSTYQYRADWKYELNTRTGQVKMYGNGRSTPSYTYSRGSAQVVQKLDVMISKITAVIAGLSTKTDRDSMIKHEAAKLMKGKILGEKNNPRTSFSHYTVAYGKPISYGSKDGMLYVSSQTRANEYIAYDKKTGYIRLYNYSVNGQPYKQIVGDGSVAKAREIIALVEEMKSRLLAAFNYNQRRRSYDGSAIQKADDARKMLGDMGKAVIHSGSVQNAWYSRSFRYQATITGNRYYSLAHVSKQGSYITIRSLLKNGRGNWDVVRLDVRSGRLEVWRNGSYYADSRQRPTFTLAKGARGYSVWASNMIEVIGFMVKGNPYWQGSKGMDYRNIRSEFELYSR